MLIPGVHFCSITPGARGSVRAFRPQWDGSLELGYATLFEGRTPVRTSIPGPPTPGLPTAPPSRGASASNLGWCVNTGARGSVRAVLIEARRPTPNPRTRRCAMVDPGVKHIPFSAHQEFRAPSLEKLGRSLALPPEGHSGFGSFPEFA
jgi:hypothetical protein